MPLASEREELLVALALQRPASERAGFLAALCGPDQVLRRRVEELVDAVGQVDCLIVACTYGWCVVV